MKRNKMKQIKRRSGIVATVFLMFFACNANAAVIWELNNFLFDDGTSATGSFTWNEATNVATSWDILTIDGSRSGTQYSSTTGSFVNLGSFFFFGEVANQFRIGLADLDSLDTPSASLTLFSQNPGSTGPNGFLECTNCGDIREGEAGAYLSVSAVPVPAAVWLFGSGLVGLIGVARRKA